MGRTKRFISGALTGYCSITANVMFTVVSVPLALMFLDKQQFGIWALAAQINGYLILLDLGMGNATNRFIADHKDNINGGEYGSHLQTSCLVYIIQGLAISCAGFVFAFFAGDIFSIPANLQYEFRALIALLALNSGISIASRSTGAALWAFQRMDVVNICFSLISLSFLAFLWLGFSSGLGVIAFALAQFPGTLAIPLVYLWVSKRNGYFPRKGNWGRPRMGIFKRMLAYGKDVFTIQLGNQLLNASQIIIISRILGLGAAATYAIGTKVFMMSRMLLSNPISSAAPILTELYVRNEQARFKKRFNQILCLSLASATIFGAGITLSNGSFVSLWTSGKVYWYWQFDYVLGLTLILRCYTTSLQSLFAISKHLHTIRLAPLIEGIIFVITASLAADHYGLMGVLVASLLTHLGCSALWYSHCAYGLFGKTAPTTRQAIAILFVILLAGSLCGLSTHMQMGAMFNMLMNIPMTVVACLTAWWLIIDEPSKEDIKNRIFSIYDSIRRSY